MSSPVNFEKDLDEWTYEELCKWACWEIIQSICEGKALRSTVHGILGVARRWNPLK